MTDNDTCVACGDGFDSADELEKAWWTVNHRDVPGGRCCGGCSQIENPPNGNFVSKGG